MGGTPVLATGVTLLGLAAGAAAQPPQPVASGAAAASMAGAASACERRLDAQPFLVAAQARGLAPGSDCLLVDMVGNHFFAPPATACSLRFAAADWLAPGWEFVRLQGVGGFTSRHEAGALIVTIEARGGFSATEFTLRSQQPMAAEACQAMAPGELLR